MKHIKILIWVLVVCLVWFSTGCMNAQKASNYMRNHPDVAAPICADLFPVRTVTDTKSFDSSIAVIDSLVEVLANAEYLSETEKQELLNEISIARSSRPDCDSVITAVQLLAEKESKRANELLNANKQLQTAAKNVKPIRDTIENTAKVMALQIELQNCADDKIELSNNLADVTSQRDKWRSEARKYKTWLWVLLIASLAIIFRKQLFSLITKIPIMKAFIFLMLSCMVFLTGCADFHNSPGVSVWSEGLWILPWLTGLAAAWFAYVGYRAWRSGHSQQIPGRPTIYSNKNVKWYKVAQFYYAAALFLATLIIIYSVVSNR